jgi:cobalt-precorrin-5B (C1)-methyltransferase
MMGRLVLKVLESNELDLRLVNGRLLRRGWTTGSCAAAAAGAAAWMLLFQKRRESYALLTPKGVALALNIEEARFDSDSASCAIKKDAGDDPDATRGVMVYAKVRRVESGIRIDGGEGVGRVTKPGLDQNVGEAAINTTPRRMITKECKTVAEAAGYSGGFEVIISIPGGEEIARRTFNPRVGIIGGISVLGTSGIVEPMSEAAYVDSLRLELRQLYAEGKRDVVITVGNFAVAFAREKLGLSAAPMVKCSNFIGEALDAAVETGFVHSLLVGHIGKLVKLGIGIPNTHSSKGDGRMETLIACALEAGGSLELLHSIADCAGTDLALTLLRQAGLLQETMRVLGRRMEDTISRRTASIMEAGFICFNKKEIQGPSYDKEGEIAVQSGNAEKLLEVFR